VGGHLGIRHRSVMAASHRKASIGGQRPEFVVGGFGKDPGTTTQPSHTRRPTHRIAVVRRRHWRSRNQTRRCCATPATADSSHPSIPTDWPLWVDCCLPQRRDLPVSRCSTSVKPTLNGIGYWCRGKAVRAMQTAEDSGQRGVDPATATALV
jgi:hypothetical protein